VCSLFVETFKEVARDVNLFVHMLPEVAIIARENIMGVMLSFAVVPCLSHFKNSSKLSMRWQTQTKDKLI
jgi:hypothetical protein